MLEVTSRRFHIFVGGEAGWRRPTAGPGCWGSLRRICVFLLQSCEKITRALWHSPLWLLQKHRRCSTQAITTLKSITEATRRTRENSFLPKVDVRLRGCTKTTSSSTRACKPQWTEATLERRACSAPTWLTAVTHGSLLPLAEASCLVWDVWRCGECVTHTALFICVLMSFHDAQICKNHRNERRLHECIPAPPSVRGLLSRLAEGGWAAEAGGGGDG